MHSPRSTFRLIKNELLARQANRKVRRVVREHTPADEQQNLKISFHCECSSPVCRERVLLTLEQYEKLHNNRSRFVVIKGHATVALERTVKKTSKLEVVEKHALKSDS